MKYTITIQENEDYSFWNDYRAKADPEYKGEVTQRQIDRYKQQLDFISIPDLILAINRMEIDGKIAKDSTGLNQP